MAAPTLKFKWVKNVGDPFLLNKGISDIFPFPNPRHRRGKGRGRTGAQGPPDALKEDAPADSAISSGLARGERSLDVRRATM